MTCLISKLNLVQVILKIQCNIFPQKLLMYVLCLAEMELIYFIAAWMVLCCGFVTKLLSITQQYFSYCWTVLAQGEDFLFCPCLCHQPHPGRNATDGSETWEWNTARTADPKWSRDIPSHTALRLAIKNGGRQRRCLPSRLLLRNWLNTGLFMGSSRWFRLYCLFASTFLHLLHCLYLNPQVFLLLFFLLCSLSYCREVSEWAAARLTGCCLVFQYRPIRYVVKHIWLSGICCLLSKSCNAVEHTETSQRVMANKLCIRAGLHDLKDNSYKHLANSQLRKVGILSNMFLWC